MSIIAPDVDQARLQELCAQACPESQVLDFKRLPPGSSDSDKRELLKDVCAMANADGGALVYGIDEQAGMAQAVAAIAGEPFDAAMRRLGQVIDAGIEPRITGLRFQEVPVTGGYVLIVRVPASFDGPHCFIVNGARRFVMRNGIYIQDMSYGQLRTAFDRTATLAERARRFRENRLALVGSRHTWKPMMPGPICAVHLIPLAAMAGNRSIDISALHGSFADFALVGWGGASRTANLDGLVFHPGLAEGQKEVPAYTHVFRSGAFEAARYGGGFADLTRKVITALGISEFAREAIDKFLKAATRLGYSGPAVAGIALLTIGPFKFGLPSGMLKDPDRDDVAVPEVWIDEIASVANVDKVARPLLDVLWQAFDEARCDLYDSAGKWNPPR